MHRGTTLQVLDQNLVKCVRIEIGGDALHHSTLPVHNEDREVALDEAARSSWFLCLQVLE